MDFTYKFDFPNQPSEIFDVHIYEDSVDIHPPLEALPKWTELSFHTCPHCTLDPNSVTHCPLSVSVANVVDRFQALISYSETTITVTSEDRTYSCATTIQRGLGSLLGLIIATSGCPHTAFFRPMAHFHLPDSTCEETIYRVVGMYFIGQYFRKTESKNAALDLHGLSELYANVEKVNAHVAKRIKAASTKDAPINALIVLDYLAKNMFYAINDHLMEIRPLWSSYLTI